MSLARDELKSPLRSTVFYGFIATIFILEEEIKAFEDEFKLGAQRPLPGDRPSSAAPAPPRSTRPHSSPLHPGEATGTAGPGAGEDAR